MRLLGWDHRHVELPIESTQFPSRIPPEFYLENQLSNTKRHVLFALIVIASIAGGWSALAGLFSLALTSDEYTHTMLMPLIGLSLLYIRRKPVFADAAYSFRGGSLSLLAGIVVSYLLVRYSTGLEYDVYLFLRILALVAIWVGGFILCYGARAVRRGAFPLLFAMLMIPIPGSLMEKPIALVQHGSAGVASVLFAIAHVPVFQDQLRFSLPGLEMEVAIQCSGIHSTLGLLIASLIICCLWVKPAWKRVVLVSSVFPIVCLTNGLRIFTVAVLSVYVDPIFFRSDLHRRGGVLFFILALGLLAGVVKLLAKRNDGVLPGPANLPDADIGLATSKTAGADSP